MTVRHIRSSECSAVMLSLALLAARSISLPRRAFQGDPAPVPLRVYPWGRGPSGQGRAAQTAQGDRWSVHDSVNDPRGRAAPNNPR